MAREELPWKDIYGKALDYWGRAKRRLKPYGIKSKTVRAGDKTPKGYATDDFYDAWKRYLPAVSPDIRHKGNSRHIFDNKNKIFVPRMWRT